MTIYISGKITDNPNAESQFKAAEFKLKADGHKVVNPMRLKHNHDQKWVSYMRVDIAAMMKCDALYQLPSWRNSCGAKLEYRIAKELKMTIMSERRGKV